MDLIISTYLFPFAGLILLAVMIKINPLFNQKQSMYLMAADLVNIFLIVVTSLDYLIAQHAIEGIWMLRRATTFLNFSIGPLIPLLLLKIFSQKKSRFLFYIPAIVNAVVCIASINENVIFYITAENYYDRGFLFFLPFLTNIFYISLLMFKPVNQHIQTKKMERRILFAVIALLIFSMVLEVGFRFYFMTYGCSALGLIMYYMLLNIQGFTMDPLTGVYNRVKYNSTLDAVSHSSRCMMALIDIDNFKQVNDTYGHDAGDRYLIRFVDILVSKTDSYATLYRIGGDEFVLMSLKADKASFTERLGLARKEILQEGISFSYGVVQYLPDQDMDKTLKEADIVMYKDKTNSKLQIK